jgi:hypothetical protein
VAKAGDTRSTLLKALERLSAKLPPELLAKASGSPQHQAPDIDRAGSINDDLARVLTSIEWAKIDPLVALREFAGKHPELFRGPLEELLANHSGPLSVSAPKQQQPIDPFRTGASGRPTAVTVILQEAERRIKDGEVNPLHKRQDFADELTEWWRKKRLEYDPAGPTVKVKTIYERLGPLWRKFPKPSA